jgi:DNA-binding response OmpR family regulator
MNSINLLSNTTTDIARFNLSHTEIESSPCDRRCKGCSLFPYEKLESVNITRPPNIRAFNVNNRQHKISYHGFRLLCALTRQSNNVLSKEYLISYAWPESDIAKNNLNVSIYDLRLLFRDSLVEISNHRKEGYSITIG